MKKAEIIKNGNTDLVRLEIPKKENKYSKFNPVIKKKSYLISDKNGVALYVLVTCLDEKEVIRQAKEGGTTAIKIPIYELSLTDKSNTFALKSFLKK